jgi:CRP-like cAMP-binding protein
MKFPVLSKSQLFSGLSEEEIEGFIGSVNYRLRFFPAGKLAALMGEEITSVMIVLSGSMRGEMVDLSGRIIKIEDVYPPHTLAAAFIYGTGARYPVNVIANTDAEVLIINRDDYLTLMKNDKRILVNYLNIVCTKALFLSDRLRFISFHTIKGKFAHYISSLPGAASGIVMVDRTQQELSEYFGVTRPSLARAIGEMEEAGLISVAKREVRLLDVHGLSRLTDI